MVDRFDGSPEMQSYKNGDYVRYSDYAALEARAIAAERALAERAGGVKVKALEWKALANTETEVGFGGGRSEYTVIPTKNAWRAYGIPGESDGGTEFFTKDAAKAAAQADYERRILSALEPAAPEERQEAVAWRAAMPHGWAHTSHAKQADEWSKVAPVQPLFARPAEQAVTRKFALGDHVTKTKGSSWTGRVVGFYSTPLTPVGYAVESDTETGSVQIYPEAALKAAMEAGRHE